MKMYGLLLGFLLSFVGIVTHAQESWELVKDKNDIRIFNRKIEGSKLKEYKGIVKVKASVEEIFNLLTNYKMHDKFIYKAKEGSVDLLKKTSNEIYTYMIINTPWPAANRDIVTKYEIKPKAKDGTITINVSAVDGMKPEQSKIVRVEDMKGFWKIKPLGNGFVEITHQAYSKPGGNVPDGMANSASVSAPYDMLFSLKNLLQ